MDGLLDLGCSVHLLMLSIVFQVAKLHRKRWIYVENRVDEMVDRNLVEVRIRGIDTA